MHTYTVILRSDYDKSTQRCYERDQGSHHHHLPPTTSRHLTYIVCNTHRALSGVLVTLQCEVYRIVVTDIQG